MGPSKDNDRPAAPKAEKRHVHRRRTLKEAKVVLSEWTAIDCTMRDVTEEGAKLVFGDAFQLPEEFRVLVVSDNTLVPVRLLWQRGLNAGVVFTGPEQPAPTRKF
jgi:hypothetical protein